MNIIHSKLLYKVSYLLTDKSVNYSLDQQAIYTNLVEESYFDRIWLDEGGDLWTH